YGLTMWDFPDQIGWQGSWESICVSAQEMMKSNNVLTHEQRYGEEAGHFLESAFDFHRSDHLTKLKELSLGEGLVGVLYARDRKTNIRVLSGPRLLMERIKEMWEGVSTPKELHQLLLSLAMLLDGGYERLWEPPSLVDLRETLYEKPYLAVPLYHWSKRCWDNDLVTGYAKAHMTEEL
ncbi:MAG: hypothetical protein AAGM67_18045, partial [Bacteroidota bacterium]